MGTFLFLVHTQYQKLLFLKIDSGIIHIDLSAKTPKEYEKEEKGLHSDSRMMALIDKMSKNPNAELFVKLYSNDTVAISISQCLYRCKTIFVRY